MSNLKDANVNKCVSLLREFIEGSMVVENKKRIAALALNHLQKITAGTGSGQMSVTDPKCNGRPRGDMP